jgi:tetratricopeptide (TPR) repeat protein
MRNSPAKDAKGRSSSQRSGKKARPQSGGKGNSAGKAKAAAPKSKPAAKPAAKKEGQAKSARALAAPAGGRSAKITKPSRPAPAGKKAAKPAAKPSAKKSAPVKASTTAASRGKDATKRAKSGARSAPAARAAAPARGGKAALATPARASKAAAEPVPSPTVVVKAFEIALKAFHKGDFKEARDGFESIITRYPHHTDIIARVTTYLNIAKQRLKPAPHLPQTSDSFYDRGVFELNNWNYDAAIGYFERALKASPKNPYVLYSLAAAQVRTGKLEEGMRNLERAVEAHDSFRYQARRDQDFAALRGDPHFQELVGIIYEADSY